MRTHEQTTTIRCQENQENDVWQVRRNCRKNADTEWVIVQKDQWSHYHHAEEINRLATALELDTLDILKQVYPDPTD